MSVRFRIIPLIALLLFPAGALSAQDRSVMRKEVAVENVLVDAVAVMQAGDLKTAVSLFGAILKEDPRNDAANYYMGMLCFSAGDVEKAESFLKTAISLDPGNDAYAESLAEVYASSGMHDKAVGMYSSLYEKSPARYSNPYVLTMLGDRELSARRDSLAMEKYQLALDRDPSYVPALLGKAEVLRLKGNYPAFFVCMNEFAQDTLSLPSAKASYIEGLLKMVDTKTYRIWGAQLDSLVETSLRVSPKDSSMLKLAGGWYYGTGRREKGREMFSRLSEAYPDNVEARLIQIQFLFEAEKFQEVIRECRGALPICKDSEKVTMYSIIGDSYYRMDDRKKAYAAYEEALKIDPAYAPVLNNYAYYLSLDGKKLRKAEKMSAVSVGKEPENPTYLDTYAWILHLLGKDAEAKVHFKKAVVYGGSSSAVILSHYAEVLRALGDEETAKYYDNQAQRRKQ